MLPKAPDPVPDVKGKYSEDDARDWAESTAALRALSAEVNAGLLALAENDLKQFEAHVAAQEKLCDTLMGSRFFNSAKLRGLATDLKKSATSALVEQIAAHTPAARMAEIQARLGHLNRVYASVVVRAQSFFQLLLSLRGTRQGYSRDGKVVTDDHTWSCEA